MGRTGENVRQRKDGRWEARAISGYDEKGHAIYRSFYGKTREAARRKRELFYKEMQKQHQKTEADRKEIRYSLILDRFLEDIETKVMPSSLNQYQLIIKNHIRPNLGSFLLSDLNGAQIDRFIKDRIANGRSDGTGGLSDRTVRSILSLVRLTISYGDECGYAVSDLNWKHTPRTGQTGAKAFSMDDQRKLEAWLEDNPGRISFGIWLALYTGLHTSELCALQNKDVNFENREITICRKVINGTMSNKQRTPKIIDCARRCVLLPDFLFAMLADWQQEDGDYILSGSNEMLVPEIFKKEYQAILKDLHLEKYNIHSLSNTFAANSAKANFRTNVPCFTGGQ